MARSEELAWAAGLFEGEGSCFLGSGQRQPVAALVMTDEDVVRRFASIIEEGTVRRYQPSGDRKPFWRWSTQSRDGVLIALGLLWPYLGERRKQRASEVIEHAATMTTRAGKRTHCKRGHDLDDPQHLYVHLKTGKRHCRTCRNERVKTWNERRRVSIG